MVKAVLSVLLVCCSCQVETDGVAELSGFSWRARARCGGDSETLVVGRELSLGNGWTCMAEPRQHGRYETMAVQCWNNDASLRFLTSCEPSSPFGHAELELGDCTVALQCN